SGAHDISVGGLGVALARLGIASRVGAEIALPLEAAEWPTASLFGERGGRVLVSVAPESAVAVAGAAETAEVRALRLGTAGGSSLDLSIGETRLSVGLDRLLTAWSTA